MVIWMIQRINPIRGETYLKLRPELAMAQLQDMEDIIDEVSRGSGSYRVSSSTGVSTIYGYLDDPTNKPNSW